MISPSNDNRSADASAPDGGAAPARPRVLLLAYACSPGWSSEGAIGWHRALEAAQRYDTWVLVADNFYADNIRHHLAEHGEIANLHFAFVPHCRVHKWLSHVPGGSFLARACWQRRALAEARRLHGQQRFDLVHHVNFCGYREPGYLWKLDAPFVWGPVGGTQDYPWRFLGEAGLRGGILEAVRTLGNWWQLRFSHRVRQAVRRARVLMTANSTGQRDFARVHGVHPVLMLETGAAAVAAAPRTLRPAPRELRILWSGMFTPGKCLPLLLKALAQLPTGFPYQVRILGRGWRGAAWQRQAERLGVADHLEWLGWLPRQEVDRHYAWADVLVFTSLRDTSGNVVLEAMASGLPVICLDHQGVHDFVSEDCGVKIPVTTPREVVCRLADALQLLAWDGDCWQRSSAAALRQAGHYLWSRQGARMATIYERVVGRPATKSSEGPVSRSFRRVSRWQAYTSAGKHFVAQTGVVLTRTLGTRVDRSFGILNYHRVAPAVPGIALPTLNATPEQLGQQLAGLQRRGYVFRPLSEMLRLHRLGQSAPPRTLVLTFDDGFAAVYRYALPILRQYDAPATVFLSTAYLDSRDPFPFDRWGEAFRRAAPEDTWRPLTLDECREMLASGLIELGAHTHTHRHFACTPELFYDDARESIERVRQCFGLEEVGFAFPFGYYNQRLMEDVRRAGASCALTLDRCLVDPRRDPFGWGRFGVDDWDTAATLAAKREGWYGTLLAPYDCLQQIALHWALPVINRISKARGRAR
jgi:glycosyltransferase involved in cell wall biosynthesis/peptidoglycan/xylan/chitin deacetylase (PgdA/CDA1 family)